MDRATCAIKQVFQKCNTLSSCEVTDLGATSCRFAMHSLLLIFPKKESQEVYAKSYSNNRFTWLLDLLTNPNRIHTDKSTSNLFGLTSINPQSTHPWIQSPIPNQRSIKWSDPSIKHKEERETWKRVRKSKSIDQDLITRRSTNLTKFESNKSNLD